MKKELSVFIDESGDFGFIKDASKYYILTFVFHDQTVDLSSNFKKIDDLPTFHAGPIIRREYPFHNEDISVRKKLFHAFFMFTLGVDIKCKSLFFIKKNFNEDIMKMERTIAREIYNYFNTNYEFFSKYLIKIYYDNGQNQITKIMNTSLAITGLDYEFKKEVNPSSYRLFQVADFISTIKLMEQKMNFKELSNSELKFIDLRYLKKNYIKMINKKEL